MKQESQFQTKFRFKIRKAVKELEDEGEKVQGFSILFNNPKKNKWKKGCHFIKLYNTELVDIIHNYDLDSYELSSILLLLPFVEYETNLIAIDGIALNKKDIVELLKYSENKVDSILRSLVEKKILAKTKVGRSIIYHFNPYIAFRGTHISPETESIFRDLE